MLMLLGGPTFSGNGIAGSLGGFASGCSSESVFTRLAAVGDAGSSVALRLPSARSSGQQMHETKDRNRATTLTYFLPSY